MNRTHFFVVFKTNMTNLKFQISFLRGTYQYKRNSRENVGPSPWEIIHIIA